MPSQPDVFAGIARGPDPLGDVGKANSHLREHLSVLKVELDITNTKVIRVNCHVLWLIGPSRLTKGSRISRRQAGVNGVAVALCDIRPHTPIGIGQHSLKGYCADRNAHAILPRAA